MGISDHKFNLVKFQLSWKAANGQKTTIRPNGMKPFVAHPQSTDSYQAATLLRVPLVKLRFVELKVNFSFLAFRRLLEHWLGSRTAMNLIRAGQQDVRELTYYCAQSISWYSLDLSKHAFTPSSSQSFFT